jgi:predicted transposase YbfD/YdcC
MDAMGCQKNIAEQIVNKKGNYVLGLKQNHPTLHKEISSFFARHEALNFEQRGYEFLINETTDKGHGRIEIRKIILLNDIRACPQFVISF